MTPTVTGWQHSPWFLGRGALACSVRPAEREGAGSPPAPEHPQLVAGFACRRRFASARVTEPPVTSTTVVGYSLGHAEKLTKAQATDVGFARSRGQKRPVVTRWSEVSLGRLRTMTVVVPIAKRVGIHGRAGADPSRSTEGRSMCE